MIKLIPFYEHKNKEQIITLYFNMVASVLPFYPEDIFSAGKSGSELTRIDVEKGFRVNKQTVRKLRKNMEERFGIWYN